MTFKLNLLAFSIIVSASSFAAAYDKPTNKTCSGTVWISSDSNSAPLETSLKLVRTAGSSQGEVTMSFDGFTGIGTYTVANQENLEANFEISNENLTIKGKITQMDDTKIGIGGKISSPNSAELNFVSFDLKCAQN